ncbi:Circadian clock protein kinase KaiC [Methylobacterium crusticola]|uniref:non-specific serine/threonine protein kinase n=1 Tax=Methylobacterium crusticola TaxID=1697972 RepID=A0ABQ4QUA9_9HYPH|nr:ATPase domain-containing protein [Methylobacterium crusticola]GJD48534.1 Circadian clock protein kinase KaiC [Methylobacterium crusticola]
MTGSGPSTPRDGAYGGLERVPTGIAGLDAILGGGLFRGGVYIVQGTPGAGKTILGNQACYTHAGAHPENRALYVTLLAESHARMLGHIAPLGFFDAGLIPDRITYLSAFRSLQDEGLTGLLTLLRRETGARDASLVVLDGLVAAEETARSALEFKTFIHELQTQAAATGATVLLLTSASAGAAMVAAEHTMVDGLIELSSRLSGRRAERDLEVRKFRGSGFLRGRHAFRITDDGVVVYPRTEARLRVPSRRDHVDGPKVTTGSPALDAMLGGGLPSHSTTMLAGPAGIGKTTLGLQFLGADPDEPGLMYGFYESEAALRVKARALALPIAGMMEAGQVAVLWQPATEGLIDEVCADLLDTIRNRRVRRVFLDGLDAMRRLAEDQDRIVRIFAALTAELRALGVTGMYTTETDLHGLASDLPMSGTALRGASSIAENIVLLRFVELRSSLHRVISVIKARDSRIDPRLRGFDIREGGLAIEDGPERAEAILAELRHARRGRE